MHFVHAVIRKNVNVHDVNNLCVTHYDIIQVF